MNGGFLHDAAPSLGGIDDGWFYPLSACGALSGDIEECASAGCL